MRSQQSFMAFMNCKDGGVARRDVERLCCAKCRFSTKDAELFARHVSHHKEMTFSCALCSHVSYSKTESQKHVVEHTGSYPYRCSFCSYGAVRRDYMVKHILRIHKKDAEDGLITDTAFHCASVPETLGTSAWPRHPAPNPHVQQQDAAPHSSPSVSHMHAGPTVAQTSARGTGPANTEPFYRTPPSTSLTPHVVLRSREDNGNSPFNMSKPSNRRVVLEKPILKPTFPRVPCEPLRVGVPEKATHPKAIPRVQIRPPAEVNVSLRPLLNMLSKRKDQRAGLMKDQRPGVIKNQGLMKNQRQSLMNGTNVAVQKNTTAPIPSAPVRSVPSERSRTSSGSGSSVQVELLAPLNQPIQHNRPLTVSCPEEINIPAGCLVELVEVKNVNGTRELELRMVPSAGAPPQQRLCFRGPEGLAGPSTAPASITHTHTRTHAEMPIGPSTAPASVTHTRSETPGESKPNLRDRAIKCTTAPLTSESLPVISSVFSLCSTPKKRQSKKQPVTKEQPVKSAVKRVCDVLVKKEEPEEKHRSLELKETKVEGEELVDSSVHEDPAKTEAPDDPKHDAHMTPVPAPNTHETGKDGQRSAPLMYPKVTLVRIPSSMMEPAPKRPKEKTPAPSVMARPVLCCSLLEQNVSIKLILKRDLRHSEEWDSPPRKKHKKDKRRAKRRRSETSPPPPSAPLRSSTSITTSFIKAIRCAVLQTGPLLRLTPFKAGQRVTCPGPNQPVVVLNHPCPATQTTPVPIPALENSTHTQPSLKMRLKKLHGHTYQVMELVEHG